MRFLSFLCLFLAPFFRFSALSFIPHVFSFLFAFVRCDRPPTLIITHFIPSFHHTHPKDGLFPHQARVAAQGAIPSCSFASVAASLWIYLEKFRFQSSTLSMTHFSETPHILKVELGLGDRRHRVDFSIFNFITPSFRVVVGRGEVVDPACPFLSATSCCVTLPTFLFPILRLVSGQTWTPSLLLFLSRFHAASPSIWLSSR